MSRMAANEYILLLCEGEEPGELRPHFYITKRLPWEVCHKHRNIRRETPAGTIPPRRDGSGVRSL